jgi:hypothetical protein
MVFAVPLAIAYPRRGLAVVLIFCDRRECSTSDLLKGVQATKGVLREGEARCPKRYGLVAATDLF